LVDVDAARAADAASRVVGAAPGRRAERRFHRLDPAAGILGALLVVAALLEWRYRHLWLDDPYISFRYAWNLVHGFGLTYNSGQRVEGFSNPSWTVSAAAALALRLDPLVVSQVIGAALHLGTVIAVWIGVRRAQAGSAQRLHGGPGPRRGGELGPARQGAELGPSTQGGRLDPARLHGGLGPARQGRGRRARLALLVPPTVAAAAVATSSWSALWAVAGLETPLFAFALVASAVAYQAGRRTAAAAFMLLASLTRIEGIAFALAFAVVLLRERGFSRAVRRPLAVVFLPFLAVLAAGWLYYGHLLPNSYTDKTGLGLGASVRAGTRYLLGSLRGALPASGGGVVPNLTVSGIVALLAVVVLGLLGWLLRVRTARGAACWLVTASLCGITAITVFGGGDWMPVARFLVPAVPLAALGLGWALAGLLRRWPPCLTSAPSLLVTAGVLVTAVLLVVVGQGQRATADATIARYRLPGAPDVNRSPSYLAIASWLQGHAHSGDLIAIEEAGLIPFQTPQLRYLDLFGLTDETIARGAGRPPFDKHNDSYVLASKPHFMVIWGVPGDQYGSLSWTHQLTLVRDSRFSAEYRPVLVAPKDNHFTFVVYERRS